LWLFLAAAGVCRRAGGVKAGAPAAPRRQARARTNELDARQAAADDRERGAAFPVRAVRAEVVGWFPGRVWAVGVVSHAPIRLLPRAGRGS
jgi:hypothetical protein